MSSLLSGVRVWPHVSMAGRHAGRRASQTVNTENHLVSLHVFVFSRLQYFFLFSLLFLSFFLVTVLVLFWYSVHTLFCISSFLSVVASFHFFLLSFGSPTFFPYF